VINYFREQQGVKSVNKVMTIAERKKENEEEQMDLIEEEELRKIKKLRKKMITF